jgi:hypothetical protein
MRASTVGLSLALLSLHFTACAGSPGQELRSQVALAEKQTDANSTAILCGFLNQAIAKAGAAGKNIELQREYEDIQWQIQQALAARLSPEARAVLVNGMARLPQPAQVTVALALKEHPPSPEIAKAALSLLKSTQNIQVQVALLDLLGAHRVPEAAPLAARLLDTHKLVMVQIAACRALARIPSKEGIPALIEYLDKNRGSRMRHEAVCALRALSGMTFGVDAGTWRTWWESAAATFTPPPTPTPAFNYELELPKGDDPEYYSIPVVENRVVFVVDTSLSMKLGGSPNRWERARYELEDLIDHLDPKVQFNIVQFSTKVTVWQEYPLLVPATPAAKKGAKAFLDAQEPLGSTETTGALEKALRDIALTQGVETIYLLSDGAPNPMRFSGITSMNEYKRGIDDIQQRIRLINQSLKIRIHTIGIYTKGPNDAQILGKAKEPDPELMKSFLETLAKENDGVYREVK